MAQGGTRLPFCVFLFVVFSALDFISVLKSCPSPAIDGEIFRVLLLLLFSAAFWDALVVDVMVSSF